MDSHGNRGKFFDQQVREKAIKIVNQSETPVDIQFVALKLPVAWATARAILLDLVREGKVIGVRTRSNWIFLPPAKRNQSVEAVVPAISAPSTAPEA